MNKPRKEISMALPKQVLEELSQGVSHVASLVSTLPDHIAYVLIFGSKPQQTRLRGKYHIIWVEMSNEVYQAYREGSDIGWGDAEHTEEQWVDTPEELEQILAPRVHDFNQIVWTGISKIPYPK